MHPGLQFSDNTILSSATQYHNPIDSLAALTAGLETTLANIISSLSPVATSGAFEDLINADSTAQAFQKSAFENWLADGNVGTESDYIDSLEGEVGSVGPIGPQGETGATGETGPIGEQGPMGEVGLMGDVGPQGLQGIVGPAGPMGPAGADGVDASSPMPVMQGSDSDNDGAIPYYDGVNGVWSVVKPNDTFGNNNVPLKMCNGVLTFGPCVTVTGNRIDMDY